MSDDLPESHKSVTRRLSWLEPIAVQLATETGMPYGDDIEDIVIIAFEGLLNDPTTHGEVSYDSLLDRARRGAARWAQEHRSSQRASAAHGLGLPVARGT